MFEEFTERVIKEYNGEVSIILFGSRGRGDNRESSDFDVLVILREKTSGDHQVVYQLKPGELPADAVIVTPEELETPVIKKMLEDGKIVYDGLKCLR